MFSRFFFSSIDWTRFDGRVNRGVKGKVWRIADELAIVSDVRLMLNKVRYRQVSCRMIVDVDWSCTSMPEYTRCKLYRIIFYSVFSRPEARRFIELCVTEI